MIEEVRDYAIILLDVDGTILSWNQGAEVIEGYTADEIVGKNFRIFYLPTDKEAHLPEQLLDFARTEGRVRHIGQRIRKDGSVFWCSILITALHDDDGSVVGFTKVSRELSGNVLE
jgi:PAS domain S-box-containing protein